MYCASCGKDLPAQASFCPACGAAVGGAAGATRGGAGAAPGNLRPYPSRNGIDVSEKSRLAALLLCLFLGWLGVHRFYVGKIGTGVLMIFTFGGLGIWTLIDLIMIIVGGFKDVDGKFVLDWQV